MISGFSVDVLLATYNGERYLPKQLASLMAEDDQDFRIIARDDGSCDGTVRILEEFAAAHPGRMLLHPPAEGNCGARGNFSELMRHSSAPYVMFCDQDDSWHPDKISRSLAAISALEQEYGADSPLLIHGDLRVVAADLSEIHPSFAAYEKLDFDANRSLRRLLVQNVVTGCTMLFNRRLVEIASPVPDEAILHDHWLALVAAAFGHIGAIRAPLVDYRQHGGNVVGAVGGGLGALIRKYCAAPAAARRRFQASWRQAQAFLDRYGERLDDPSRQVVASWASMSARGWFARRWTIMRQGFWKTPFLRSVASLLVV